MRSTHLIAVITVLAGGPALGQGAGGPGDQQTPGPGADGDQAVPLPGTDLRFKVSAGYQYLFESDVSGGGGMSVGRAGLAVKYRTTLARDWRFEATFRYLFDDYDLSSTVLGPNPWSDIHTVSLAAMFEWWVVNDVALIFGPTLNDARESGVDWGDGVTGGGIGGLMFVSSPRLVWGFGLGVMSQIEDDVLVYPIIILDWRFADDLKLTSVAGPVGLATTGLELVWDAGRGVELGLGGRYEFRRFRVAGATPAANNGVGEDTSVPIWARVSYKFNENFKLDLYGGLVAGGELLLENSSGIRLGKVDYDPAPSVAIALRIRF